MSREVLENLVHDGGLVADAAVRLGRLPDDSLLTDLATARDALAKGDAPPELIQSLQKALNEAIVAIDPITLDDLRGGWRPYTAGREHRLGTVVFFVFALLLMAACAYTTQVYERARSVYQTTLELQDARGAEQAMRLFGMLKRNQQDVIESLVSGKKEFLYEVFSKALFDLEVMNLRFKAYAPIASDVLRELEMIERPRQWFDRSYNPENPAGDAEVAKILQSNPNYGPSPVAAGPGDAPVVDPGAVAKAVDKAAAGAATALSNAKTLENLDVDGLVGVYVSQLRDFNDTIKVGFNPLEPNDYFEYLFRLRNGMNFVGLWVLPALYGMLGAVIFHMRRLLNPTVPDPTWMRMVFRVLLGAFAGIIIVWFWTPSAQKTAQPEFANLTAFGLAFLVGFSTDVFFRALDRFVDYASQAVGRSGA